ncbi:hypothetical protein EDC39_102199 [Geothermobacter ehrlichii]|uniref:Uncharacterized protein n=1 Tax=Geothermobacter ehrlichii TaxID=213224 RepID=A0A5D3WKZ4_9BACT|nr:hypothetical protein [Geothermobacter ehrlichii]TYO99674.1 hypothetical protein EDC39_102199 [Geothermobacter ehrlichii]
MEYPEYLRLLQNDGRYKVKVVISSFDGSVADLSMEAIEIKKMIDPSTGLFYEKMRFDDWLLNIYKYEIDPVNKIIKIKTRLPND